MSWISPSLRARLEAEGTTLYRIHTAPGGTVERFGGDVLLSVEREADAPALLEAYRAWAGREGFAAARVFRKILQAKPGPEPYALLEGDPAADRRTVALENGLSYRIDFGAGYSCGLFLDQRENRRFLRELGAATVFNGFAYTCAFSVAAAAGGAETVSVDVAPKALAWGKENFALNGLDPQAHRFWPDDVRESLHRQERRNSRFAAVILDPPSFARTPEGKVFRVQDELPEMAAQALGLLETGGHLLLSTNLSTLTRNDLADWAETAARQAGRKVKPLPVPAQEDLPPGEGARTLWVRAD
ncbi:MAG: class I SAM-dependent methyltransferase [Verrucomicrobium sp.]|nr:class I SAM-dependent methyltransferase [Verrucomicrobium sp.]